MTETLAERIRRKEEWLRRVAGDPGLMGDEAGLMRAAARADREGRHEDAMDLREEAEIVAHGG